MEPKSDKKQVLFNFHRDEDSEYNDASRKNTANLEIISQTNSNNNTGNILNFSSNCVDDKDVDHNKNDTKSEGKDHTKSHIMSIDGYDRLNIKRQSIKRKTRKNKTEMVPKSNNLKIERFNNEITKITEDILINNRKASGDLKSLTNTDYKKDKDTSNDKEEDKEYRSSFKKKTIRFADKRVTYQYPKEIEAVKFNINDNMSSSTNDNDNEIEKMSEDKHDNPDSCEKETNQFGFNEEEN